jgi:hypothetical protein
MLKQIENYYNHQKGLLNLPAMLRDRRRRRLTSTSTIAIATERERPKTKIFAIERERERVRLGPFIAKYGPLDSKCL